MTIVCPWDFKHNNPKVWRRDMQYFEKVPEARSVLPPFFSLQFPLGSQRIKLPPNEIGDLRIPLSKLVLKPRRTLSHSSTFLWEVW